MLTIMSRTPIITAIDLGTDKCVTLIAGLDEQQHLRVMGVAAVPSRGMRNGQMTDLEKVYTTVSQSLDAAERMAGVEVQQAFVSISGKHIRSQNSNGVVAVATPDQEIVPEDVTRVIEAARAISMPSDREIVHVIAKDYKVDTQEGITDPVGMTGVRLETEVHIVTGLSATLRNLQRCIEDLGISVAGFVFAGLAAAEASLSETEKELGVAIIDIGASSSSLCVYVEGSLEYSASIPIGAKHLTQDIAVGCRLSLESAEKIKHAISTDELKTIAPEPGESKADFNKRRKEFDQLNLSDLGITETSDSISKRTIVEGIMVPRMQELFELVLDELRSQQLTKLIPAGVVLTGGGASSAKILDVAKRVLDLPARVGEPVELRGLVSDIQTPGYATSIGLLLYGRQHIPTEKSGGFSFKSLFPRLKGNAKTGGKSSFLGEKISSIIRSLLP
jgi:cell division protein FtsA